MRENGGSVQDLKRGGGDFGFLSSWFVTSTFFFFEMKRKEKLYGQKVSQEASMILLIWRFVGFSFFLVYSAAWIAFAMCCCSALTSRSWKAMLSLKALFRGGLDPAWNFTLFTWFWFTLSCKYHRLGRCQSYLHNQR